MTSARPPCIVATEDVPEVARRYPRSGEIFSYRRSIGKAAGLTRLGVNLLRLPPGHRSTLPHAESSEEEFVLVLEGQVDAWLDGHLYPLRAGDFVGYPAGSGITHCLINNSGAEARLLVGGEADKSDNRLMYPLNPERRADLAATQWWEEWPARPLGPHDGRPDDPAER